MLISKKIAAIRRPFFVGYYQIPYYLDGCLTFGQILITLMHENFPVILISRFFLGQKCISRDFNFTVQEQKLDLF